RQGDDRRCPRIGQAQGLRSVKASEAPLIFSRAETINDLWGGTVHFPLPDRSSCMLRAAVAGYLVLVTAAGPLLCCCSAGHPGAASAYPVALGSSQPQGPVTGCCQPSHGKNQQPGSKDHAPTKPGCPCQGTG